MYKLLLLLTLFFSLHISAQDRKCKLDISKNEFTGNRIIQAPDVKIIDIFPLVGTKKPWHMMFTLGCVNDTIRLILTHESQLQTSYVRLAYFKFEDGSVLKKECTRTGGTTNNGFGYNIEFTVFLLTKDELVTLASKPLEKFHLEFDHFSDSPIVEKEFKEKAAKGILQNASCLLKEIQVK